MARFQMLPMLLVVLYGVGSFGSVSAALVTNAEHLPEEQNTQRHHAFQKDPHRKATGHSAQIAPEPAYELEHGQSEANARQFVAKMTEADLNVPDWCKECNATVLHYCRTARFLNDHCCCEYSHAEEKLPWIYHTCHRQLEGDCKVNAGTCGTYRVIKECCCDRETKLESKNKYSIGSNAGPGWFILLLALACAFARSVPLSRLS